jgi:hypothetical protein
MRFRSVLDRAAGLLRGLALRGVLRLEDGDLLEAHGFSYMLPRSIDCGEWRWVLLCEAVLRCCWEVLVSA